MLLTFKTQLNLSDEQQTIVDAMSNDGRMLHNHFLGKLKEQYEKDKTFISYYNQQKELKDYKCGYLTFDVKKEILIIENYFNYGYCKILLIIFIKIWDSFQDIKRELGFSPSNICRCCKGEVKRIGGFLWEYED